MVRDRAEVLVLEEVDFAFVITPVAWLRILTCNLGRGGFQQSYGPPAAVLGIFSTRSSQLRA